MDSLEYKKRYKDSLKKIGNDALNELEPVVKKTSDNVMDFIKEVFNDFISNLFEMRRKKRQVKNGQN